MSERGNGATRGLVLPREHGAWGQFLVPCVTALGSAGPTAAAVLLALSGTAMFLSHESVLLLVGQRGESVQRRRGPGARRTLSILAPAAITSGGLGLLLAPSPARWWALLPVGLGAVLMAIAIRGREKSTWGEVLAAATAAAAAVPVALAGGMSLDAAVHSWATWALAFGVATAGVRLVLSRHTGRGDRWAPIVLVVATGAVVAAGWRVSPLLLAALPHVTIAWWLLIGAPHPRYLRRIGWTLVAATVLTGVLLAVAVRLT